MQAGSNVRAAKMEPWPRHYPNAPLVTAATRPGIHLWLHTAFTSNLVCLSAWLSGGLLKPYLLCPPSCPLVHLERLLQRWKIIGFLDFNGNKGEIFPSSSITVASIIFYDSSHFLLMSTEFCDTTPRKKIQYFCNLPTCCSCSRNLWKSWRWTAEASGRSVLL